MNFFDLAKIFTRQEGERLRLLAACEKEADLRNEYHMSLDEVIHWNEQDDLEIGEG